MGNRVGIWPSIPQFDMPSVSMTLRVAIVSGGRSSLISCLLPTADGTKCPLRCYSATYRRGRIQFVSAWAATIKPK